MPSITIKHQTFTSERIRNILSGDEKKAYRMGFFDQFRDLFRRLFGKSKLDKVKELFDEIHKSANNLSTGVDKFESDNMFNQGNLKNSGIVAKQIYTFARLKALVDSESDRELFKFNSDAQGVQSLQIEQVTITKLRVVDHWSCKLYEDLVHSCECDEDRRPILPADFLTKCTNTEQECNMRDQKKHALEALKKFINEAALTIDETAVLIQRLGLNDEEIKCLAPEGVADKLSIIRSRLVQDFFASKVGNSNISEYITRMDDKELSLALKAIDIIAAAEKDPDCKDNNTKYKNYIYNNIKEEMQKVYRPNETLERRENHTTNSIDSQFQEALKVINGGSYNVNTQFTHIGYEGPENDVKFRMVHPIITFLILTYREHYLESGESHVDYKATLNKWFEALAESYDEYTKRKEGIDEILKNVYNNHKKTLSIMDASDCYRNMLT